jgi:hypothetical protein
VLGIDLKADYLGDTEHDEGKLAVARYAGAVEHRARDAPRDAPCVEVLVDEAEVDGAGGLVAALGRISRGSETEAQVALKESATDPPRSPARHRTPSQT